MSYKSRAGFVGRFKTKPIKERRAVCAIPVPGEDPTLMLEEQLMGVRRPNLAEVKPLKLQLPLNYVLALHKMRIVGTMSVSEIVEDALKTYFDGMKAEKKEAELVH
jgi:hypothetical protein